MVSFTAIRPVSREQGLQMKYEREQEDANQRRLQNQMADVEYRADLEPHMDPVSRVGFDPNKARPIFRRSDFAGIYSPIDGSQPPTDQMQRASRREIPAGGVMTFGDYVGNDGVIAHEFRHRGFDLVRRTLPREEMVERYGEEAATLYFDTEEEVLNDMMDRFNQEGELEEKPEGLSDSSEGMSEWDAERHREVLNEVALGVLEGRGSPPPAERREARTYLLGLINSGEYKSREDSLENIEARRRELGEIE